MNENNNENSNDDFEEEIEEDSEDGDINQIGTLDIISILAERKHFAKKDVKEILDGLVELFEECALEGIELKVRSFGKLHFVKFPARKLPAYTDKGGYHEPRELPETVKINFKLSGNIRRYAKLGYEKRLKEQSEKA